jgi:PAS domain S-box-containing protein
MDAAALPWGEPLARALAEHSADIILVLTADHRCRFASPAVERVPCCRPDEVLGTDVSPLHHPDDLPRAAAMRGDAAVHPGRQAQADVRLRHCNGT